MELYDMCIAHQQKELKYIRTYTLRKYVHVINKDSLLVKSLVYFIYDYAYITKKSTWQIQTVQTGV